MQYTSVHIMCAIVHKHVITMWRMALIACTYFNALYICQQKIMGKTFSIPPLSFPVIVFLMCVFLDNGAEILYFHKKSHFMHILYIQ